ncbi:hypothetical protein [Pokkaliibacter plantistimulans]|uniref:hypothetical protein n=1 Tax=Pokkaliibacter plantistimulans TaxID=1635171 RepID=UPI002690A61D|nr:hypothetical protein [Pokkaliibacter plantistimulans]
MKLAKLRWKSLLTFVLSVFFAVGAFGNLFASECIASDFIRWRYPAGFHYVTRSRL